MFKKKKKSYLQAIPFEDKLYYAISNFFIVLVIIIAAYPIIYMYSASFSSKNALESAKVWLWPVDFSLDGYKAVFKTDKIFIGYRNTIFYTLVATVINVIVTMLMAYPLSRKNLIGKKFITLFVYISGILNGGVIPQYILFNNLGIVNTPWVMILPGMYSMYFVIVARTTLQSSLPDEILEAAKIDGCSDARYFFKMVLPLSKPIIAVMAVNYALGHWNDYFNPMIYLTNEKLYPLQLVIKNILIANEISSEMIMDMGAGGGAALEANLSTVLKYSTIVLSITPVLCVMPFVRKYFEQGIMLGSVKG